MTQNTSAKSVATKSFSDLSLYAVDHNGNVIRLKSSNSLEKKALKQDKEYNRLLDMIGVRA